MVSSSFLFNHLFCFCVLSPPPPVVVGEGHSTSKSPCPGSLTFFPPSSNVRTFVHLYKLPSPCNCPFPTTVGPFFSPGDDSSFPFLSAHKWKTSALRHRPSPPTLSFAADRRGTAGDSERRNFYTLSRPLPPSFLSAVCVPFFGDDPGPSVAPFFVHILGGPPGNTLRFLCLQHPRFPRNILGS